MESVAKIDALGQFELHPVLGAVGEKLHLSQSPVYMVIACGLVLAFLYLGMRTKAVVPGRLQSAAEIAYEFVRELAISTIGEKGTAFFPFIFALFFFILAGNYLGLLPYSFTFTSHIVVTLALAMVVFIMAIFVAIYNQGFGFFKHFMPAGAPVALAPLLVPVEILSYLSRPISLSIRLFANMVAGHVLLEVFASFTIMLAGLGTIGYVLGAAPVVINIALMGLELVVGGLQAYVFAILTCMYLQEACETTH
ncbi:F0F1 ATP synthase subunit A [Oecophyllibacter saccharovorans]|uniref:ATP synthase subunit a n=1 Tax=Oecophyllibacter saccharovorans TaxID=2558360 RepID=A0A506UL17_9PROT|nr:F0F1 ATP synthase subunit A [Oecophyllibacter saccharovorans]QDH15192.1 F0F1 ATP synthase subunit A [Oecophyllibacter saccharovorans]TPW33753.1 F0F1 ATP synthase subunit A [Oecophyllibacter saccharovorans]TPW34029.1 F0F1 ATP synthase subunit A [Oecophyllibacter saccharovorans]